MIMPKLEAHAKVGRLHITEYPEEVKISVSLDAIR